MKKVEIIFGGFAILGFLMKLFSLPGSTSIFILGIALLMFWYFTLGFAIFNNYNFKPGKASWVIAGIVSGFFMSTVMAGILFKWMFWPGAAANLLLGIVGLVVVLAFTLMLGSQSGWQSRANWIRWGAIGAMTVFTYLIPATTILDLKYPENPEVAIAYQKFQETRTRENNERYRFLADSVHRARDMKQIEKYRPQKVEE